MAKIKLTKGELKRQRDSLKQFRYYLPTLQLKKQQLQMKISQAYKKRDEKKKKLEQQESSIKSWVGILADSRIDIKEWITPINVATELNNIAGADVPIFKNIEFNETNYDFYKTPFWIDKGIEEVRKLVAILVEIETLNKEIAILHKELRVTTQRVNLFEKVKIPDCIENIRVIRIYLGDQMANAVGISKVAKKKIYERELLPA